MGTRYLIDSNVIIDFTEGRFSDALTDKISALVDDGACVSVITKIEVLGFSTALDGMEIVESYLNRFVILDLDEAVVMKTIELRRSKKIKLPDAIIAATALVYDLKLYTSNLKDFNGIKDLKISSPRA